PPAPPLREQASGRCRPLAHPSGPETPWPIRASNRLFPNAVAFLCSLLLPSTRCPIVGFQPPLSALDHTPWRRSRCFREHVADHDGILVRSVDDAPLVALVGHGEFMAPLANGRHRPGVGEAERLPLLETPEECPHFEPSLLRERRRFDLAV